VPLNATNIPYAVERIAWLEDQLAQRDVQLADAEARLQELAYVTAHDLAEPLRTMTGFLDLLVDRTAGRLDARSEEFVAYAVDGAQRMKELIDDLLRYSRVVSGPLERVPVDVGEVLEGVMSTLDPLFERAGATLLVQRPLADPCADASHLSHLLQNLLANAAKFRPPERGTTVIVSSLADARGGTTVIVADNGIGVPPAHAHTIFQPFRRLNAVDEYAGTGIGLAICRRIAERHDATIAVTPTTGGGATFRVRFPSVAA